MTPKEEAFCQAIAIDGLGPSAAYRKAYGGTMAPDAVASNAKRVLRRSHIKTHIEELRGQVASGGRGLTPRQDAFCLYYLEMGNASEAYRRAYEVRPATKPETVHRNAHALLRSAKITARLAQLRAGLRRRYEVAIDRLVEEFARLAFSNVADLIDWDSAAVTRDPKSGEIVATADRVTLKADAPRSAWTAVHSIEITERGVKLRMHDKTAALDGLARHLSFFDDGHIQRTLAVARAAGEAPENGLLRPATFWRLLAASAPDKRDSRAP
jgi:phage terminase small subunit